MEDHGNDRRVRQSEVKALVTGGAGFIGSHVVEVLLAAHHEVVALDNLTSGYRENLFADVEFVECDVRDPHPLLRACTGAEVIFHLAASVGNRRGIESPSNDAAVNVAGTLNVLEAARINGCRKVVYSSSAAVIGEPRVIPIPDDHPAAPLTPYGASKLAGEMYVRIYRELFGLETVALRYFNVYGVRQRFDAYGNVIPIFATQALLGKPISIHGDGLQTRDFVNATDVARANLAAAQEGVHGVLNVGSGVATTIGELAESIQRLTGRGVAIRYGPPRPGDVRHSQADVSGLTAVTGYRSACALDDGLRAYLDWLSAEIGRSPH